MLPSLPIAGEDATAIVSPTPAISATKVFSPVAASTLITVPLKFTTKMLCPPPTTIGEDMKYGGSEEFVATGEASTSAASAVVPVDDGLTFQRSVAHPGEHLYKNPSCPAYTSDPSGNSAGDDEIAVPVCRHPRGEPVWISRVKIRRSCVPT
jgi:hypothetical protein